jgi:hypothetical protein
VGITLAEGGQMLRIIRAHPTLGWRLAYANNLDHGTHMHTMDIVNELNAGTFVFTP